MKKLETLEFFEAGASGKVLPLGKMSHYMLRDGVNLNFVPMAFATGIVGTKME